MYRLSCPASLLGCWRPHSLHKLVKNFLGWPASFPTQVCRKWLPWYLLSWPAKLPVLHPCKSPFTCESWPPLTSHFLHTYVEFASTSILHTCVGPTYLCRFLHYEIRLASAHWLALLVPASTATTAHQLPASSCLASLSQWKHNRKLSPGMSGLYGIKSWPTLTALHRLWLWYTWAAWLGLNPSTIPL